MLQYLCEFSFNGILTAIYDSYLYKEIPEEIIFHNDAFTLFSEIKSITTNEEKAEKVRQHIIRKISKDALNNTYLAFLSEKSEIGTFIFQYIRLGFQMGSQLDADLANPIVHKIHALREKVTKERHRFLGILRFQKILGDIYYAPCTPDSNIIILLAPHFAKRFMNQNWIIHDTKRNTAIIYDTKAWFLTELANIELRTEKDEELYQRLWQAYFSNISITNRKNRKLQNQFLPKKYRHNLIEKFEG